MTKGVVVVLGKCGRNFAAGMSGGIAYVFDEEGDFARRRCNLAMVDLEPLVEEKDNELVHRLIRRHAELTGSRRARCLLERWTEAQARFVKIFPHEYKRVLGVPRSSEVFEPMRPAVERAVAAGANPAGD
jgi:glutamate synthase domain-containing protein 3